MLCYSALGLHIITYYVIPVMAALSGSAYKPIIITNITVGTKQHKVT